MDVSGVFSKIKSTFTSTVSEISAALPGNPLLREYDVGNQMGSAGPGLMWKLYNGVKKSTKKEVAIWVLEKKLLDQYNKADKEVILDVFRHGCMQLTKLRHPRILIVESSMEESRESLCFCTEPVFASLANVLGQRLNISNPSKELQAYELHEVEIKYGLMQLSEALAFLHDGVKMVHGNLCPESVILNNGGAWKIAGFDFCTSNKGSLTDVRYECKEWDTSLPSISLPNPNYVAPEYILHKTCDSSNDLFSLGALLYTVYYSGKTFQHCSAQNLYKTMSHSVSKLEHINSAALEKIPNEVKEHEKMLLNIDPNVRPNAEQVAKLPFFNHVGVMTLQYLDSLLQRDNLQKSQFFKGLPKTISQLPKRVVMQRVLPCLTSEFSNPDMIPFVLPSIMIIAEDCSDEDFVAFVFPPLIPVFKLQKPVQILLILLQKMELLLSKTPSKMIQHHILPMLSSALGSSSLQIQELSMSIIPNFSNHLEAQAIKSSIIPKIRLIAVEGETIAVRVQALVCCGKMVTHFDKWFVQDEILPFLQKISSKEPGVLMAILGIYQTVLTSDRLGISKQVLASRALPFLIPLSIENTLNLKQYNSFMNVIKEMLQRIENEHRTKLEQLGRMKIEQEACLDFQKASSTQDVSSKPLNVDDVFTKSVEEPPPVARQHLTLEEKQRLAKMKEQEYQMKKVGEIKPVSIAPPPKLPIKTENKPKDLTSTLLKTNLTAMSLSTNPNVNRPPSSLTTPSGFSSQRSAFNPPLNSFTPASTQWAPMSTSHGMATPSMGMPQSVFPNNGMGSYRPSNNSSQMTPMSGFQSHSTNSSFDSLLSLPSQRKPTPMNQMQSAPAPQQPGFSLMAQQAPLMSQNKSAFNNSITAGSNASASSNLTKQDLLDFLG